MIYFLYLLNTNCTQLKHRFAKLLLCGLPFAVGTIEVHAQPCTVQISSVPENCGASCNGSAVANPSGLAPFTFSWQPGGQTTPQISGLCPGSYTCTITDSTGCVAIDSVIIQTAPFLNVWISSVTNPSCVGCSDGSATGSVTGGAPPYYPFWNPPVGFGVYTVTNIPSGSYTFCVTDANGCTSCDDTTLSDPTGIENHNILRSEVCSFQVFDLSGRLVEYYDSRDGYALNKSPIPIGTYVILELDCEGNVLSRRKRIVNE